MDNIYSNMSKYDIKIILGDCNAKISKEEAYIPTIGKYSKHKESNENGIRLIGFAMERSMVIRSTEFQHKEIHKGTWPAPNAEYTNQIDHVLIE